jgi:asparagine synthetase B (glutamine-hydrolysing)
LAENLLERALYFEMKTFLHGFLVTEDRISMAHGLETRVPLLDNELVDLAWRIPPRLKVDARRLAAGGNGHLSATEGKQILRRAMRHYLPEEFTNQPKQGFSSPDENWYRGPSMDYIKSVLFDRRALERPWFDQDFLRATLNDHFAGRRNYRLLIWSLLSLEWLQRHFIDQPVGNLSPLPPGEAPRGYPGVRAACATGSAGVSPRPDVALAEPVAPGALRPHPSPLPEGEGTVKAEGGEPCRK